MKVMTRRSVLQGLGVAGAGSFLNQSLIAAEIIQDKPILGLPTYVDRNSTCIFIDGSWLLRATDSNILAVTVDCSDHKYYQGKWTKQSGQDNQDLPLGEYTVTQIGAPDSCTCPCEVLSSQSHYLPYLHGVKCKFEDGSPRAKQVQDGLLRVINLPTPDKIHTAARITFGKGDYEGTDATSGSASFSAPSQCPTVVIFEYKRAQSLTIAGHAGSSVYIAKGDHYHFRVTFPEAEPSACVEREHIKSFSTMLGNLLVHQSSLKPVSFYIDPADMVDPHKTLRVRKGVWGGVTTGELGIIKAKKGRGNDACTAGFLFGDHDGRGHTPFFVNLANCVGGTIGGGK